MQTLPHNIYLVGPMGAGKSTLGRYLAQQIQYTFIDSDQVIVERTGVDIPTIFDYEGESGFRKREEETIAELIQQQGVILATGGGAILSKDNRQRLKNNGFVVYLQTTVDEQLNRIGNDTNRPLMRSDNPRQQLEKLMIARAPLYESVADLIFDTNTPHMHNIINELHQQIMSHHTC